MIDSDKPVFLYIIDKPVSPSKLDSEQYEKVQDFKKKYSANGLYKPITSTEDLEKSLTNNMTMYFLTKAISSSNDKDELLGINRLPELKLETSKIIKSIKEKFESFLQSQEDKILNNFKEIQDIYLPIVQENISLENKDSPNIPNSPALIDASKKLLQISQQLSEQFSQYTELITPIIPDKVKEVIEDYLKIKNLTFNEDLFHLGNLVKSKNKLNFSYLDGGNDISLSGTANEKEKYNFIMKLYNKIIVYNGAYNYFKQLLPLNTYHIYLSNAGQSYDEDIDIKIILPKGTFIDKKTFPIPNEDIIDMFSNIDLLENLLVPPSSHNISSFDRKVATYTPHIPLPFINSGRSIDSYVEDYNDNINDIFEYELFFTEENDIVNIKFDYIKHNTSINFPSYIFTNLELSDIKFEISSKHTPELIEGIIDFK